VLERQGGTDERVVLLLEAASWPLVQEERVEETETASGVRLSRWRRRGWICRHHRREKADCSAPVGDAAAAATAGGRSWRRRRCDEETLLLLMNGGEVVGYGR
jgi:hypothetical protein